jgi:hypothetical protein
MIYRFFLALPLVIALGCSSNEEPRAAVRVAPKVLPKPKATLPISPNDPSTSLKTSTEKPKAVQQEPVVKKAKTEADAVTPNNPIQQKAKKEESTYTFPQHAEWKTTFENNAELMALYEESVTSYLKGVQNNLNTQPKLMIKEHMVAHVYGEKVYNTFYESPEFAEFCKTSFKKSEALKAFLSKNKKRIIWD